MSEASNQTRPFLMRALLWVSALAFSAGLAAAQPVFTQSFSPASVGFGAGSTVTYTIDNSASADRITSMSFSNDFPDGITIAEDATTTCGNPSFVPTLTTNTGAGTFSFSAFGFNSPGFGALEPGATCVVTLSVTGAAVGVLVNTSSDLTYNVGSGNLNAGTSTATLTVEGVTPGAPLLVKTFPDPNVDPGGTVVVNYTITNTSRTDEALSLSFDDPLSVGLPGLALTSVTSNSCGGTVTGTSTLQLATGTLAAASTCEIVAVLTAPTGVSGTFTGQTDPVGAVTGGNTVIGNQASADLTVRAAPAPTLAMSFSDTVSGGTTTASFTLTNLASSALTNGAFTVDLAPPLGFPVSFDATGASCGAGSSVNVVSLSTDSQSLQLSGGSIAANDSCTFSVDINIAADQPATPTNFQSTAPTATISGASVTGVETSATLTIGAGQDASFTKTFSGSVLPGGTVDLSFDITAPAENTATITGLNFTDDLDAMLTGVTGQSGTATDSCGGSLTGSSTLSYSGGSIAPGSTCTITVTLDIPASASSGTYTNTTSNLTDATGQSFGLASADLSVAELSFDMAFTDDPVIAGGQVNLEFMIGNDSATNDATNLTYTFNLNDVTSGLTIASTLPSSACNGTLSAAGSTFIIFTGGSLNAGTNCTIPLSINVGAGVATGSYGASTSSLTASINGAAVVGPNAADVLEVNSATLLFTSAFASATLPGGTVAHNFTIDNQSDGAASALAFSGALDSIFTGTTLDSVGTNTCGFTVGGVGTNAPSLSGGSVGANTSCTVTLNYAIPGTTPAAIYPYITTDVSGTIGGLAVIGEAISADLTVAASASPAFSKGFAPSTINVDGTSTLTYTIDNPVGGATLSNLTFNDDLGGVIAGLTLSGVSGDCGVGSVVSAGTSVSLSGGNLTAGESCTFSVSVSVGSAGAGASYPTTSGDLFDSGLSVAAGAAATLTVNPNPPGFAKAIAPASIAQGGAAVVTYTIDNTANTVAISALAFTDTTPTNATLAATPAQTNGCGGALSATVGGNSLSLSGGTIAAGASCTIALPITSTTVGVASSTSSALSTAVGDSPAVTASLTVTAAPVPTFAATFTPDSIVEGATSLISFGIDNSAALIDATNLSFSNSLPAGVTVSATPAPTTDCTGGVLSAVPGSSLISYSGGSVVAGASCNIDVAVTSVLDDTYVNTSGDLTSDLGNSGTASDTLTVTQTPAPTFAQTITPNTVVQGNEARITFDIDNSVGLIEASAITLNNTLPAGMIVASTPNIANTCGGTPTATAEGSSIALSGGILSASTSCAISVTVRGILPGALVNTPDDLTSSLGNSGGAPATLTVTAAPLPGFSHVFAPASIVQGADATVTFSIDNSAAAIEATALDFTDTLPANVVLAATPALATTCTGGTLTGVAGGGSIAYTSGTIAAGASCTVSAVVTSAVVNTNSDTTGDLTSSLGNSGTSTAALDVTAAPAPGFAMALNPTTIVQGAETRVTLSIDNTGALVPATSLAVDLILPADVTLSPTPNAVGDCDGGAAVPIAGGASFSATNLDAGATCSVAFNVVAAEDGTVNFLTGDLTSSLGNSGTAGAALTVTPAPIPTFAKAFGVAAMEQGDVTTLTFTIDNASALVSASAGAFSDPFPTDMTVAATPNLSASCSTGGSTAGTFTGAAGATSVSLSGTTIEAGANCTYSVDITVAEDGSFTNTSNAFTSSLGDSGTAVASINITPAAVPSFAKAFSPTSIEQGDVATLSVTVDNATALVAASSGAFSDSFPSGMVVADTPNLTSVCSSGASTAGTVTGAAGTAVLSVSGASLAAGESCTYSVDVTVPDDGSFVNTTGDFTSSLGNSGIATATLTVTPAAAPSFSKAFSPDSIVQGDVSTLSFTIDNGTALVSASAGAFSDTFPSGVTIADTPNLSALCTTAGSVAGSATGTAGSNTYTVFGITLEAGASCTYSVDVTASVVDSYDNVSDSFTSSLGDSGTASATLTVTAAPAPDFAKSYAPDSIEQGTSTTATYTIDNAAALVGVDSIAFSDTFPAGAVISTPANANNGCGGTLSAVAGGTSLSLNGGALLAGEGCQITVDVTASTVGSTALDTSDLTSSLGNSGTASASLTVTAAAAPGFAKVFAPDSIVQGATSTLTFSINNTTAFVQVTDLAFTDVMPAGLVVADPANAGHNCDTGTLSTSVGSDTISFANGTLAAAESCEISVDVTAAEKGQYRNESGSLTSDLGDSGTAKDVLNVTGAPNIRFRKDFDVDTIVQGGVITLTHTLNNSRALVGATDLTFTESFPAGTTVASPASSSTDCTSATVTAVPGATSYQMTDGTIDAGATCTVSVALTSTEVGTVTTQGGDLSSNRGTTTPDQASFEVTPAGDPEFDKSFSPSSILESGVSTLTLTIDNTAALVDAESAAFSDVFPAGMTVAATPNLSTTCSGGTLSGAAGSNAVSYTGGTIPAGSTCAVQVDVTSNTVGIARNVSDNLRSSLGNSGKARASLNVQTAAVPTFTNAYVPAQIIQGGSTTLVFTVDNAVNFIPVGPFGFNTNLPAGLSVSAASGFGATGMSTTCGGSVTAPAGATSVSFSGGTVAAGTSCTVSVPVTSTSVGTLGAVSGTLTTPQGSTSVSGGGSGPLVVVPDPQGRVTFVQESASDATFSFASSETALNFAITTSGGSGSSGPISVDVGTYVITQTRPDGFGNTALSCNDADSTVDVTAGVVTLRLASFENVTCTFSSGNSAQLASETINSFLNRRNTLILANGPSRGRRLSRLNQGVGGSQTLAFQRGDLKSMSPVNFNLLSLGSGSYSLSTSLSQVERAGTMFALAHDGDDEHTAILKNRRFDIWFEAHYSEFKASQGSSGHFGIAYVGADYLVSDDILAGFMLQFDSLEDTSVTNNTSVDGNGWMAGPYMTARLAPNLIFDGRLAYGQSNNDFTTALSTGNFDTDRWLIDLNLSGNFDWKDWVISPNLNISYIEDRQHAFRDSLNVLVPEQTVSLGQIKLGPTFSTSYVTPNQVTVQPSFTLNGIYNFGNRSGPLITNNTADESNGFRGRIEAGVKMTNRHGMQVDLGANYDGIGQSDFESWGVKVGVRIPLQ